MSILYENKFSCDNFATLQKEILDLIGDRYACLKATVYFNQDIEPYIKIVSIDDTEDELALTLSFDESHEEGDIAAFLKDALHIEHYTLINQTFNEKQVVHDMIEAVQQGKDYYEFAGRSHAISGCDVRAVLAGVVDVFRTFAGEGSLEQEQQLLYPSFEHAAIAVIQQEIHQHKDNNQTDTLTVTTDIYCADDILDHMPVTVYKVLLNYHTYSDDRAKRYQTQFTKRFQINDEADPTLFLAMTLPKEDDNDSSVY